MGEKDERMPQILIIYTTLNGRTGEMVDPICEGIRSEGVSALPRSVGDVTWEEMQATDGIIVGNPRGIGDQHPGLHDVFLRYKNRWPRVCQPVCLYRYHLGSNLGNHYPG